MNLPESKWTNNQRITKTKLINNGKEKLVINIRYDDDRQNGHNSFAITSDLYELRKEQYCNKWILVACGLQHELVDKHFPELKKYLKWHLCSSNGPMHYVANTVYWINRGNLDHARCAAIWQDATEDDLLSENIQDKLLERLPALMEDFKRDMEELGFTY